MTLIQTDVQPEVAYGRVTGYFVSYLADSADAGTIPDEIPLTGTVLLTPLTTVTRWPTTTPPRLAIGKQASCPVVAGYLCTPGSSIHDVWLVATDQPEGQPNVIQWKASFKFDGVVSQPADVVFNVPAGGVVDLALVASVPPAPGTIVIVSHEDALRADVAADAAEASATEAAQSVDAVAQSAADAVAAADAAEAAADSLAILTVDVAALRESAITDEDLSDSVIIDAGLISATRSQAVMAALQNLTLEQASLSVRTAVAASDTNYWTIALWQYRSGVGSLLAAKTTKVTNGTALAAFTEWNFDAVTWTARQFFKGDVLVVVATPTGTPPALDGLALSFRSKPTPGGTILLAKDSFDRANSATTLGTADSGQVWTVPAGAGIWGIRNNAAYVPGTPAGQEKAYLETLVSDVTVQLRVKALAASGSVGILGRALPVPGSTFKASGILMSTNALFSNDGTTQTQLGAGWTPVIAAGDTARLVMTGPTLTVFVDYGSTGTFVQKLQTTSTLNQTSTKHGFRSSSNTAGGNEVDDFKVTTP